MPIEFDCPTCQTRMRTPDEAAGKKARCPKCQGIVAIPLASTVTPLGNLGGLGGTPAPLPSASSVPAQPPSQPPAISSAAVKANPASAPVPWLPPSDAFAPKGPPASGFGSPSPFTSYTPPASQNPFSDAGGTHPGALNSYAPSEIMPLTKDEVRAKLLGPAIGLALSAVLCLSIVALFTLMIVLSEDFQDDIQNRGGQPEIIFACIFLFGLAAFAALPYVVALIGAYAMFRGRGAFAAWIGAIAGLLPCSLLFFIPAGFAIWGMVVLNDPRVQAGMSTKE